MDENSSDLVNQTEALTVEEPTDDSGYVPSAKATSKVDELMKKDADDESLQKYKESLLGTAAKGDLGDTADPRRVVMKEFRVVFEEDGIDDYVCTSPEQGKISFEMKEGCKYRLIIGFKVQHEIVSGLHYKLKVKRSLFNTTEKIVMGSYGPRTEMHMFEFPRNDWLEAPSGMMARGQYKAYIQLDDSDCNQHANLNFTFQIVK